MFIESLEQLARSEDFSPLTQNIKGTKVPTTNQQLARSEDFSPLTQNIKGTKVPTTNQKK